MSFKAPLGVRVEGGEELIISFLERENGFEQVSLKGPADFVFEGRIHLD